MEVKYEKEELKAVRTYVCCPDCGNRLEHTGQIYYTSPKTYPHICPYCEQRIHLEKIYPTLEICSE